MPDPAIHRPDRRPAWIIFLITFFCYAYFFQGDGWNQMAHFATIHALVVDGTAEITRYTPFTQDISIFNGHAYSSKPPGLVLLGTPIYFVLISIERTLQINTDSPTVWLNNLSILTICLAALPGALLNVLIYFAFRREQASIRTAFLLTGAFAFGSLSWPYTGALFAHMLCALCVFCAWYFLSNPSTTKKQTAIAAAAMGIAVMSDLLTIPIAAIFALYILLKDKSPRTFIYYSLGPALGLATMLLYNHLAHGAALDSGPFHPTQQFTAPGLFLGMFAPPDFRRLYWITYQPMRGIFVCCPIFLICLLALFTLKKPIRFQLDYLPALLVLLYYIAFYLTYYTWTGGWGVGLRFMIPAFPLLWMVALKPFQRFPKICAIFIAISIFNMLCVTSVRATLPPTTARPIILIPSAAT